MSSRASSGANKVLLGSCLGTLIMVSSNTPAEGQNRCLFGVASTGFVRVMKRALFDTFLGAITSRSDSPSGVFKLSTVVVADVPLRSEGGDGGAAVLLLFLTGLLEVDLVCTMTAACI